MGNGKSPAVTASNPAGFAFPVVGIGASAGGLDALTALLESLPVDTGLAFVVIQHLDPKHESQLSGILARSTRMSVREVTHGMVLEANISMSYRLMRV